ncbi:hypothetical protein [Actinocrispum sp. NPDC049592]|uniref:hypothetical protein n=1 Tax=Actinocrispum sp. NPDC049592 TaxID=3154835 RepID=UPI00344240B6
MTGLPNSGYSRQPRQAELVRLRAFCVLNAVLFLIVAVVLAFLRLLIDEPLAGLLYPQEILCAVVLIVQASSLLRLRSAIGIDPAGQGRAVITGRNVGAISLVLTGLVLVTGIVVVLLPADVSKFPTGAATVVAIVFSLYAYAGTTKVRRP